MHIAAAERDRHRPDPAPRRSCTTRCAKKAKEFAKIVKIGRTHLLDATPLTLGQEFSGYAAQVEQRHRAHRSDARQDLMPLAQGGTAVGTGLNAPPNFAKAVRQARCGAHAAYAFTSAANKFEALAAHDAYGRMRTARSTRWPTGLFKIANDIRLLGSGPRSGLGELILPENEPGSSIMPGKVNPTQCEALTMVCCQVFGGNQTTITVAARQGHFELQCVQAGDRLCMLQSIRLLADAAVSFAEIASTGIMADRKAHRRTDGAVADAGHRPQPENRLRKSRRGRESMRTPMEPVCRMRR